MSSLSLRLALVACTSFGCFGEETPEEPEFENNAAGFESEILRGAVVRSSDPLAKITVSIFDPEVGAFCSGIVLGRELVLTAAHCFDDRARRPSVRTAASKRRSYRADRAAFHARYSQERREEYDAAIAFETSAEDIEAPPEPLDDLVILHLEEPLPVSMRAAVFTSSFDTSLYSAGFGCTTTACTRENKSLRKVSMRHVRTAQRSRAVVLSAGSQRGSCAGDSGGPDFVATSSGPRVFAMISTGPESCDAGISVDTLLGPYLGWMHEASAALAIGRRSPAVSLVDY